MIFRKIKKQTSKPDPLRHVHDIIKQNAALRLSVLDASVENDTLVILSSDTRMVKITKLVLENHWPGDMEVYCIADLAVGASHPDPNDPKVYQASEESSWRLN